MEDKFEKYLNKNIKALPEIDHDKNLWFKIANELDFDERIELACSTLPVLEHKNDLWDRIQNNETHKFRLLAYSIGIAASILLAILFNTHFNGSKEYIITCSTEVQYNTEKIATGIQNNDNIEIMLQQYCQYSNLNCNNPEFIQIKNQLSELEVEIQKLNKVITTYGESPELIQYIIKMENQKSDLINEILKKSES
jgi:hypothetical protein